MRVSRAWLVEHGIPEDVIDRELARGRRVDGRPPGRAPVLVVPGAPRLVHVEVSGGRWWAVVEGWRPCSDNLRARGVRAWHAGKSRDRRVVAELLRDGAGIPPATGRRRVALLVEKRNRRGVRDSANLLKSLHDALKTAALLVDDSDDWLDYERPRIVVDRGLGCAYRTTITLEDI